MTFLSDIPNPTSEMASLLTSDDLDPIPACTADHPHTITSLGGGHGLFQTLRAVRNCAPEKINAVVTVADDGGSSGRIRHELGQIPPGDLRMALAALTADDDEGMLWEGLLQHRFGGHGALAGHALGNLLIVALTDIFGTSQLALDKVAELAGSTGRVLPVCVEPLDLEAEVSGLDQDPRLMRQVRGQVAVAATPGQVRRVRLIPERPEANPEAVQAILDADLVTLGPGSWFSSVIPHILVPDVVDALDRTDAVKILVLNLTAEPGETNGFSAERHIHVLRQHANNLKVDHVIVDSGTVTLTSERDHIARTAKTLGADVSFQDVRAEDGRGRFTSVHDPSKLCDALMKRYAEITARR
ncbi:gluconeogenesis factor YvcK family protein [Corynebacterium gallinarum]|uniref:gluconeogenesis factor YvcK family protein n=1 Tax=Corynebacterium gallinarum TaxID=2762214 RepID=UPI001CD8B804|nr:uridine diphosphate-N-acetylglucosamine-binding protein YvcK [Corynebacterium gallinarum]